MKDKPKQKRRHHDNVTAKREKVEGFNYSYQFLFSSELKDWQSKRAGKRQYVNLF